MKGNKGIIISAVIFILSIVLACFVNEPIVHIEEFCISVTGGSYNLILETVEGENLGNMSICIACGPSSYEDLPIVEKEGYTFEGWYYDKELTNKVEITSTMEITPVPNYTEEDCYSGYKDITLYAKFSKNTTYSCETGYTLSGTNCVRTVAAISYCKEGTYEYNGSCIDLNNFKQSDRECKEYTYLVDANGHTATTKGTLVNAGTSFCYYGETNENQTACTAAGHKWANSISKCFMTTTGANQNIIYSCSDSNYEYIGDPQATFKLQGGRNGGCFGKSAKSYKCESGYTLSGTNCVRTVNAKAN